MRPFRAQPALHLHGSQPPRAEPDHVHRRHRETAGAVRCGPRNPRRFHHRPTRSRVTEVDHAVWKQLYARQSALLRGRACDAFVAGLGKIDLPADRVPSFADVNRQLKPATGWQIVAVPGLVPDRVFFEHLANRRFPVTWWMRRPDQLDYLQEPDCFRPVRPRAAADRPGVRRLHAGVRPHRARGRRR